MAKNTKTKASANERMRVAALNETLWVDGVMTTIPKGLSASEIDAEISRVREVMANDAAFIAKRAEREARRVAFDKRRSLLVESLGGADSVKNRFASINKRKNA